METPVFDYIQQYNDKKMTRFHMPGHKGIPVLGCEPLDITEISGADVLAESTGILGTSQRNASELFHSKQTFYSTEGSSLCIKVMLAAVTMDVKSRTGSRPVILAARNVHRSLVDACALLDCDLTFLSDRDLGQICTDVMDPVLLEYQLSTWKGDMPAAVYVTSPDYLGVTSDIAGLAKVCEAYQIPLLVDNAHGAYFHFLKTPVHPMDLGAYMCCDSAHKTLPVLTGGAYLHASQKVPGHILRLLPGIFSLFGSTSPSYLTLASLDLANRYLADSYRESLAVFIEKIHRLKSDMKSGGICLCESEPLKIVFDTGAHGYFGDDIANEMREYGLESEYADLDYVVWMLTPQNTDRDIERALLWSRQTKLITKRKQPREKTAFILGNPVRVTTIREAMFGQSERIASNQAAGRICATETVSCPPAIPIAVSGEQITPQMVDLFQAYGIDQVVVLVK